MQAFIVISDGTNEIRLPINATVEPALKTEVKVQPETKDKLSDKPGHGRWNKSYTPAFRQMATQLGLTIGCGKAGIALGIPDSTIDNWVRKVKSPPKPDPKPVPLREIFHVT